MNNPRLVLFFSKIVEKINNRMIRMKLIPAMMDPMIESQFFEDGGTFIVNFIKYLSGLK